MADMEQGEMREFLAGTLVADLVTLQPDGSPHVAPVWYEYREGLFLVWAAGDARKVRNIQGDPRVALSVATSDRPYRYVLAEGVAGVAEEGVEAAALSISVRYCGPEEGERFVRETTSSTRMVLITVSPHRVMAWSEDG